MVCDCHRLLGSIRRLRGETEKSANHFETALGIASTFNLLPLLFWINYSLVELFLGENRFDDAHAQRSTHQVACDQRPIHSGLRNGGNESPDAGRWLMWVYAE